MSLSLKTTIPQAFRLHGILGRDGDYATDDESESDYFMESEFEDSDDTFDHDDWKQPPLAFTMLSPKVHLIKHLKNQPGDICSNSLLRQGLWSTDPVLNFKRHRQGFLPHLANVCFQANICQCSNEQCNHVKGMMDKLAPSCTWEPFRKWALTAMSCQAAMDDDSKLTRAHTHIARAVSGCFKVLKHFLGRETLDSKFGDGGEHVELSEVVNLMYWMTRIQAELGTPQAKISDWDHHFVPFQYTIKSVQKAAQEVERLGICKNRLWNLVNVSDRKHGDLPDIILAISASGRSLAHKDHDVCTPSKCQGAQMDSTKMTQLHKCQNQSCEQKKFPVELLATNIEVDKSTAWICNPTKSVAAPQLNGTGKDYIAISHVWSDGTGVGVKPAGTVNTCLYEFFAGLARRLDCKALWWDAISIPQEFKARHKALNTMHMNYAMAKYTVVHDSYLMNFPWSDDGSPCLALVLSAWFTRGWTALELAMAKKVKVLFKDLDPTKIDPIIKDLDEDVLAQSPRGATRAHWLATCLVQRLRKPVEDVGDLITVLAPRSTSFTRDRTIIACLLAGVPEIDFQDGESVMTRQILEYLGRIPYFCLLHGKPTMRETGGFSWSPATLDDMPVEAAGGMKNLDDDMVESMFEIDDKGSVWGVCSARTLSEDEVLEGNIKAYGDSLAATIKVNLALADWETCLLIRPTSYSYDPRCILVVPTGILKDGLTIKCRYIGTVLEEQRWPYQVIANILIGGRDKGEQPLNASWALDETTYSKSREWDEFGELIIKRDEPKQIEPQPSPSTQHPAPDASLTNVDIKDLADQLEHLDMDRMENEDLSQDSLILALAFKNKGATRFLVSRGITVTSDYFLEEFRYSFDSDDFERECRGLCLLGDVYMENYHTALAIDSYERVMEMEGKVDTEDGELSTTFLQVRLSLGRALLVHRREASSHDSYFGLDANRCVERAKELFSFILDKGEKRGNHRTIAIQRPEAPGGSNPPNRSDPDESHKPSMGIKRRKTGGPNGLPGEESTRRDERRANKLLRLELDAAAELIALAISEFDFTQASDIYRKTLRYFGDVPEDFVSEGFKPRWVERKTEEATVTEKRDKEAATIYHRALKRLSTLFKKDHLLLLITSIHLGVNFNFRAGLRDATVHLTNALEGLECYSKTMKARHGIQSTPSVIESDHAIIALVKYYRGEVYLQQEQWDEAHSDFEGALAILPDEKLEARELRNVTKLGLARYYLSLDEANPEAANTMIYHISNDYYHELPMDELHCRLLIEAYYVGAKAAYASVEQKPDSNNRERYEEAISICQIAMEFTKTLPSYKEGSDLEEGRLLSSLSKIYEDLDDLDAARTHRRNAMKILDRVEGQRSVSWLNDAVAMARINVKLRRKSEEQRELLKKHAADPLVLLKDHPELFNICSEPIKGKSDEFLDELTGESEDLLKKAFEGFEACLGRYSTKTLQTCQLLGEFYWMNEMSKAEEYFVKAFEGFEKAHGRSFKLTIEIAPKLGRIYAQSHQYTRAIDVFLMAHEGFFSESSKSKDIHMDYVQSTVDLARCYSALGGPNNEKIGMEYFDKALEYLCDHGASESKHAAIIRLRQGDLRRQLRDFETAQSQIEQAIDFFNQEMVCGPDEDAESYRETCRLEGFFRLGELLLDRQRLGQPGENHNLPKVNPEDHIAMAYQGLVDRLGPEHYLPFQVIQLLGEISLDHNPELDPNPDQYLRQALTDCMKSLPTGNPTTIRIMDQLIAYWTDNNNDNIHGDKIDDVKKKKWEALKMGYGEDIAVAIMHITDLRRKNLFSYDEGNDKSDQGDDVSDGKKSSDDEEDLSENEDLPFGNESAVKEVLPEQTPLQQQQSTLPKAVIELHGNTVQGVTTPLMDNATVVNTPNAVDSHGESSDEEDTDDKTTWCCFHLFTSRLALKKNSK